MNNRIAMAIAGWLLATGALQADDRAAIASLENAGAIVKRDESQQGNPVTQVTYNLRDVTAEGNRALKEIELLPAIEFLGAGNTEITTATLKALQAKKSLKRLAISFAKIDDDSAKILGTLASLEVLELRAQTTLTPEGLKEIFNLTNLRELTLSDRMVNDEVLADLAKLNHLAVLNVRSVFMTDAGINSIRRLKNLRTLRIFVGSSVSDEGLKQLAELNLRSLELTLSDVNDEKLKELRKFSSLKLLRLVNAVNVTDNGIPHLSELTDLKDLDLANASLTKYGIQQLKKSLPNCSIIYEARQRN